MLHHTKGIVFSTVKYSESSVVAKIYTEELGLQSYMINGVRRAKASTKPALLQPLTLLDMVVYFRENKNLQRIKEVKLAYTFVAIPFDIVKSSVALFMAEILYKTIKETAESNQEQFDFLYHYIQFLDQTPESVANVHLHFLLNLSRYLGFHPQNNFDKEKCRLFDLQEGIFVGQRPVHPHYFDPNCSEVLSILMESRVQHLHEIRLKRSLRRVLLDGLIQYFELHIENFREVKSIRILNEVLT